jgi:hypothetical protein
MQRIVWALAVSAVLASAQPNAAPHLERRGSVTQLVVDGKPFLALGGELFNNSASSLEYMKPIWPRLRSSGTNPVAPAPLTYGIFIATKPDEFYMAGSGLTVTFAPHTPGPPIAGLATVEEGPFVDGKWARGRVLAGDDTGQGNTISLRNLRGKAILHVTLYRYR